LRFGQAIRPSRADKTAGQSPRAASLLGFGAIALAALLWAIAAAVAVELFDAGVTPFELSEARVVVAAAGLLLLGGARRHRGESLPAKHLIAFGLSIAFVNATYYSAIDRLDVAVAIVLQYTAPAIVVAYVAFVARAAPPPEIFIACVVALVGVVFASELPSGEIGHVDLLGIGFGLGSAIFFCTYTLLSERAVGTYGPIRGMFRAFAIASLFWIAVQVPQGWPNALVARGNIALVLYVGVFGTLVPFLLYVWGIQRVAAARAAIAATLEPPFAAIVAWLWLGQALSGFQLLGGALILGAVVTLQARRRPAGTGDPSHAEPRE
jgi:DME family drug/metabolite transporter